MDSRQVYVVFLIGGKEFGMAIECVSSILNPLGDYSLTEHFTIGTDSIKTRDGEVPLISFYKLNNIKSAPHSERTRIIIATSNDQKAAFFVEMVKEFISFDFNNITCLDYSNERGQEYLKWQLTYDDRDILIPDFDKILSEINQS
ncbi:MAG: chemotaxis protein CheW [Ignavibacteriaceae bacterium]